MKRPDEDDDNLDEFGGEGFFIACFLCVVISYFLFSMGVRGFIIGLGPAAITLLLIRYLIYWLRP